MDEDSLVVPASWRRRLHPRRGGTPGPALKLDPGAGAALRDKLASVAAEVEELLGNPGSDPGLVAAARHHLDGEDDPLGAAVAGQIAIRQEDWRGDPHAGLVDAWCAEHGIPYAAAAVAAISKAETTWRWIEQGRVSEAWVRPRDPWQEYGHWWGTRGAIRRMRAVLAAAGDAEYEEAVDRLAGFRDTFLLRLVTAYLVPTRQDWVEECLAERGGARRAKLNHLYDWLLWCSIGSAGQLPRLGPLGWYGSQVDIATTVVEGVGTAAAPLLAAAYDAAHNAPGRRHTSELLAIVPADEAFQALADRADQDRVRPALAAAMKRFPGRAARLLPQAAAGKGKAAAIAAELLAEHRVAHPELFPDGGAGASGAAGTPETGGAVRVPDARSTDLPGTLADPPWKREQARRDIVVIDDPVELDCTAVTWTPGERESWSSSSGRVREDAWDQEIADFTAGALTDWNAADLFAYGPAERLRPLFRRWSPDELRVIGRRGRQLAARYELDAVPLLVRAAAGRPGDFDALLPFVTPEVALLMAGWALRSKSNQATAVDWFERHRLAAALPLIPVALGPPGRDRHAAEAALLRIADREGTEPIAAAARVHGTAAADAIADLMRTDPLDLAPVRAPKTGDWAEPAHLPQVLLEGRDRALPATAVRALLALMALVRPGVGYAGVHEVREACDEASLAEFSWAVFERWQAAGAPAKDGWALTQLGRFGGDDAARRLTPLIKAWPGRSRHRNAAAGLEVLAEIGTDVALMHLHGIAQKLRYKGLQAQAREKIAQVAAELGLSQNELADRLVPDFGLDAAGGMVLDYGPRRFTVGFDERLKPYVLDERGRPRRALPRPGAKDDPDLAPAAYKRFAALKKDVRTVAGAQIRRLETAMIERRRWPLADFRRLLAGHPLLRHLVGRLVWQADDGTTFRVAEDGTFADSADEALDLPGGAYVRIPHRLELTESLETWAAVFADYEIAQPFAQLDRPVHALTPRERETGDLARFRGIKVPLGRLLALERQGWEHEAPADAGIVGGLSRPLPGGATASIGFEPAVAIGYRDPAEEVTIGAWISGDAAALDSIAACELLAELTAVTEPSEG